MFQVVYTNSDYRHLPISRLAQNQDPGVDVHGKVVFVCSEFLFNRPITFTTSESYLVAPMWNSGRQGAIELQFKTVEEVCASNVHGVGRVVGALGSVTGFAGSMLS